MLQETKRKQTKARETSSLVEVTRTLEDARDVLRGFEVTVLAEEWLKLSQERHAAS